MTGPTPSEAGHAGLPTAVARAAQALAVRLARSVGDPAAVSWVHAGALLQHASVTGLAREVDGAPPTVDRAYRSLERLAAAHPALQALCDPAVVPLWSTPIPDVEVAAISALWQEHPPADPEGRPHGYQLGNAYQAVSEEARKHRALAQTPRYVTDLLIDLGMRPAWTLWPITDVRMIDPSCGTGHILVETLLAAYQVAATGPHATWRNGSLTGIDHEAAVRTAVATVHGTDLDPYAALIARYRLLTLTAALLDVRLDQVPADLTPRVKAADALLDHSEPLLERSQYHAVIANPPYVTPKTAEVRNAVRAAYPLVCHGKYALSLPFHQLMTELLVPGGWCAQLTANSFMKREFGKPFIEKYLAKQDLRWVIDTSGAYIPGHGTPTVILVHRNQPPDGDTVPSVLGIRGEPRTPADPSQGFVWQDIARKVRARLVEQWTSPRQPEQPTAAAPMPPALEQ
ncbi:Eco57I restriction-modification methylase domain-containing protein, partial [Streptomyces triculaminicus]|uniref:Eco57I restriction-modification methylase domain-containing protein n=1 Tax=Streptomyces triculaminicus TaxID=2816232 RepID=UPI0037B21A0A